MQAQAPYRPRVSRETRLLFATVILAVIALWVLARLRFPDQSPSVNPVAPVLTQLAPTPPFGDLAAVVADVQPRALAPFVTIRLAPGSLAPGTSQSARAVAALRVRDDVAVALLDPSEGSWHDGVLEGASLLNVDRATGLATLKVPTLPTPDLTLWAPNRLASPRYLLSTVAVSDALALRPVFVSTLVTDDCFPWEATVWMLPAHTELQPGTFAFTTTGVFAGLVIRHSDGTAILPGAALAAAVDRVLKQRQGPAGWLGMDVQALTPALVEATGGARGVIVTWVAPQGPAAGSIQVGDLLESMDDTSSPLTDERFQARTARLLAGDAITLQVRRGSLAQPVRLTAIERPVPAETLGLTMRRVRGGAEVLAVAPDSAADLAGIRSGDLITFAAGVEAPAPAQITRAFAAATDRPIVVGLTREDSHLVVPVSKR